MPPTASPSGATARRRCFLDGHPISGAVDEAALDALVEAELKRANGAIASGIAPGDLYALEMSDALGVERADPTEIPGATHIHLEPNADERERGVVAACWARDGVKARRLAECADGRATRPGDRGLLHAWHRFVKSSRRLRFSRRESSACAVLRTSYMRLTRR